MQKPALVDEPQDVRTANLLLLPVCGMRERGNKEEERKGAREKSGRRAERERRNQRGRGGGREGEDESGRKRQRGRGGGREGEEESERGWRER